MLQREWKKIYFHLGYTLLSPLLKGVSKVVESSISTSQKGQGNNTLHYTSDNA